MFGDETFEREFVGATRRAASASALAIVLVVLGGALSPVTGWLGGELVDRLGVGVSDGANLDAPSSLTGESVRRR